MVTCTVQVTNVSPQATEQHMKELFSYFGGIDEIRVYPEDEIPCMVPSKVCFVTFKERSSLETALHLTNTIFIDRALIVAQSRYEVIPDENTALSLAAPAVAVAGLGGGGGGGTGGGGGGNALLPTLGPSTPLLPTPGVPSQPSLLGNPQTALLQTPLSNALQQVQAVASSIAAAGIPGIADSPAIAAALQAPVLTVAGSVIPQTPIITGNVDPTKIDEIRRTVYVGNLSTHLTADQVMNFFTPCGEIKYVRMAGDETQPTRFAFVEFTNPESVPIALQYNGALFGDRPIKVNHSKNAIVKPQGKTPEMAQQEVDEAMKKVREATMAIATVIEPGQETGPVKKRSKFRSRTPSPNSPSLVRERRRRSPSPPPTRRKSRSRSPKRRRSRSRSPGRRRSRSRSPGRRRSRSRSRGRYRSPRRRKSYSRSPPRRHRRRSHSRSPIRSDYYRGSFGGRHRQANYRRRSRTPDRDRYRRRRRSYSRSRSPSPRRLSRSGQAGLAANQHQAPSSPERERHRRRKRSYSRSKSPSPRRRSYRSHDTRDRDYKKRDRSSSPYERKKSHKKKSKKEKRRKRSRSPTPQDSLSPEQSDVESVGQQEEEEEEEVASRQSSDADIADEEEDRQDRDTSRSESDKIASSNDDDDD